MKFVLTVLGILILTGGVTTPSVRAANRALSLDGDYVVISDSPSLTIEGSVTLEAWVFPTDVNGWHQIIAKGDTVGFEDPYYLRMEGEGGSQIKIEAGFWKPKRPDSAEPIDSWVEKWVEAEVVMRKWTHIAAVLDAENRTVKLYLNGDIEASQGLAGGTGTDRAMPVNIGAIHGIQRFNGLIDEVRIWNIARTQQEMVATMNTVLTGNEPGLAAYWNFDNDTANDQSPFGNDGIVEGDAKIVIAQLSDDFVSEGISVIILEDKIVNPGEIFTRNISVCLAKALHRFTFDLRFDPDVLQVVSVKEGAFLSRDGTEATRWENPKVDDEKGIITNIGCHRTKPPMVPLRPGDKSVVFENTGILAVVTFKAHSSGSSQIGVENIKFFSPGGAQIPAEAQACEVDIFPHGSISGVVRDTEDKTPISGARIEVSNRWLKLREVYSDMEGKYTIPIVPAVNVNIKASRSGTYFSTTTDVYVKPGQEMPNVDFEMKLFPLPEDPGPVWEEEKNEEIKDL